MRGSKASGQSTDMKNYLVTGGLSSLVESYNNNCYMATLIEFNYFVVSSHVEFKHVWWLSLTLNVSKNVSC